MFCLCVTAAPWGAALGCPTAPREVACSSVVACCVCFTTLFKPPCRSSFCFLSSLWWGLTSLRGVVWLIPMHPLPALFPCPDSTFRLGSLVRLNAPNLLKKKRFLQSELCHPLPYVHCSLSYKLPLNDITISAAKCLTFVTLGKESSRFTSYRAP